MHAPCGAMSASSPPRGMQSTPADSIPQQVRASEETTRTVAQASSQMPTTRRPLLHLCGAYYASSCRVPLVWSPPGARVSCGPFGPFVQGPNASHTLRLPYQAPYLPAGQDTCTTTAGAEGVFSGPKSNIPWCVAMHSPLPKYPLTHAPSRSRPYILLALLHDTTPPASAAQVYQVESRPVQHLDRRGLLGRAHGALYNPSPKPGPI